MPNTLFFSSVFSFAPWGCSDSSVSCVSDLTRENPFFFPESLCKGGGGPCAQSEAHGQRRYRTLKKLWKQKKKPKDGSSTLIIVHRTNSKPPMVRDWPIKSSCVLVTNERFLSQ